MKGRKPAQLKTGEADALTRVPPAPSWLHPEAKREWRRILPGLVEKRIVTTQDLAAVECFCTAVARVRQIEAMLATTFDPALVRAQNTALASARQYAAELGLSPVSRSRASIVSNREDDAPSPLDL